MIDSPLLLLLVLAALAAVPMLLKRHRAAAPDGIRVVGRTALHKGAVVAVIVVGDRRLLVGAGERGVDVLAELGRDDADQLGHLEGGTSTSTRTTSMTTFGGTDAAEPLPPADAEHALTALAVDARGTTVGPGIGLVDRLRALTVRTPTRGRPSHDPLQR